MGGWSTPSSGRSTPRETPDTHCIGRWVGSRAGLDWCAKSLPQTGFNRQTVKPVSSPYNDYDIPAHRLLCVRK